MAHGAVRFLIRTLEAVLLVLLLAAAFLAWRLGQGPLRIDAVAPYIATAFSDFSPGFRFRIEDAEFRWAGFSGSPELTLREVRVVNPADDVIAGLPSMVVRMSVPALKRGMVAAEQVRLSSPIIRFVHRADGTLGLGVQGSPAPGAGAAPTATDPATSNALAVSLIGALTREAGDNNPAGYLERVVIEDTTLVLVDEVTGQRWIAPAATLNFRRAGGDVEVDATLPIVEEGRKWTVTARGRYIAATKSLNIDLNVDGFRPSRVAGLSPQLAPLSMVDLILSGTAGISLRLNDGGARLGALAFDVKGEDGLLHLPAPVSQDYSVKSLALKGFAGADLDTVTFEQVRVELNRRGEVTPVITGTGQGKGLTGRPQIDLDFNLTELSLQALKQYWPVGIKPNTRDWIDQNLNNGGIYGTHLRLAVSGPDMNALDVTEARLSGELRGVSVRYMRTMPLVEDASGYLNIGPGEVSIDIIGGGVPAGDVGEGLRVATGKVRLYGLGRGPGSERADIKLNIKGGLTDVMQAIDNPPFGYAKVMGLDAKSATGDADVDLALDFPLVKDLKLDQLKIDVKGRTQDIGIPRAAFGLPLTKGKLEVVLDRAGMDVTGTAELGDIPSRISWRENFGGGDFRSQYILDPVIDNEGRPKVGLAMLPFIPPYIDGAVPAHVIYTVKRDQTRRLEAEVDLTDPAMAVPELGWRKEPGKPARAKVEALFTRDHLDAVPSFHVISGEDFDVSGNVTFAETGRMRLLTFNPSMVGDTRLSGTVNVDDAGGYTIDVAGPMFNSQYFWRALNRDDARGKVAADADPEATSFATPLKLHATFDRMTLSKTGEFSDVQLTLDRDYTGLQAIDFASKLPGGVPLTFKLGPDENGRTFKGTSEDGGSVVRALGLFGDIMGGKFDVSGELEPNGAIKGVAQIKNFQVVQAPLLARLLSVASLTGIVDELRGGGGISFSTLRVPFTYTNDTLRVNDGEMYGSSLGLTAKGTYSFASSQMDFEGTLIPAYTFNALLNSIPVIGPLLTGGEKGGGIFAATYTYRGDVATAQPSVNPLAALAPGFLRHIFDIFKPRATREVRKPDDPDPSEGQSANRAPAIH